MCDSSSQRDKGRNTSKDYLYNFSYDSQDVNEYYRELYTLVESKQIDFPVNIFVSPRVYLYSMNEENP
ncbi:MAG: hypothetical protein US72_C0023G0014 [Microgenomates group bacterium GW2011_GWC1_38_12]|nr:MAG: hypothetical protein US72_C0023G0014 [Microgenomates group bacterium GW2011_GWC1_38_12]